MGKIKSRSNSALIFLVVFASLYSAGCTQITESATEAACTLTSDSVHCKQEAAMQSGNPAKCATIGQKEEYKDVGSNPPEDKCYMMVAANKEDPSACDRIKGGMGSYSKEECLEGVAKTATKTETCHKITGNASSICANNVAEQVYDEIQAIDIMGASDGRIAELQKKLDDLEKMENLLTEDMKAKHQTAKAAIINLGN